jgi:hypothetical protein
VAIAQDGDGRADLRNLLEAVADVDHTRAARLELLHDPKELDDLVVRKRGGRLVHHDDVCVGADGPGDLDHLLLGHAQLPDLVAGIDRQVQLLEDGRRLSAHPGPVDDARPPRDPRLAAHEDVLHDRELGNQVELLVDHRDPEVKGIARRVDLHLATLELDPSGVRVVCAAEDLHQRALARAVLAEEHEHLAGADLQLHVVERHDPGEPLGDPRHAEKHVAGTGSGRHGDQAYPASSRRIRSTTARLIAALSDGGRQVVSCSTITQPA